MGQLPCRHARWLSGVSAGRGVSVELAPQASENRHLKLRGVATRVIETGLDREDA